VVYSKRLGKTKYEHFCTPCFLTEIENRVFACIRDNALINAGDHIGLGASGGKDSQFLLHMLVKYRAHVSFNLTAFMVDEGIAGYREIGIAMCREFAEANGVKLVTGQMKEEFGYTVDEFVERFRARNPGRSLRVCSACDPTRVTIVKRMALRSGCTKVALGINLDDHIVTAIVALRSASMIEKLLSIGARSRIPKSKLEFLYPTATVTDKEISLYNILAKIPYQRQPQCPYADTCLDTSYRQLVYGLEEQGPGYRDAALVNVQRLSNLIPINEEEWSCCPQCMDGHPTTAGSVCVDCERFNKLRASAGV
jgi:tRNA(Ile)-lysidine synthase TilS/MesJ